MSNLPGGTKRLTIRRPNRDIIQKNLQPLKQNVAKQVAQEHYYESHQVAQSPLTRDNKTPVHQRLGDKNRFKKRVQVFGTSTASILPKKRLIRSNNMNSGRNNNNMRTRIFTAQSRINRIRQQVSQNNSPTFRLLNIKQQANRRPTNFTVNGPVQNNQRRQKTFKLRRSIPHNLNPLMNHSNPQNFQVQVMNNASVSGSSHDNDHRFRQFLNPKIQDEIKSIQENFKFHQVIPPMAFTPEATTTFLNERFSMLS